MLGLGSGKLGMLRKTIADNVRYWRTRRKLSQEDLALQAGVHRTFVGTVERAETNISADSIERLAKGLDIEPMELLRKR